MDSPALEGVSWAQCACAGCKARRQEKKLVHGCPCAECQPGTGIDYNATRWNWTKVRQARMNELLADEYGELTPAEQAELDYLVQVYLHR